MPVAELNNFRTKYPQYADVDDKTLADKLASKYTEYVDLPEKVAKSTEKPSLREGIPLESKLYTEVVAPILHGGSTFALGTPKMVADAQGEGMREAVFPEQTTLPGKALRVASEAAGFTVGMPMRLGAAAARGLAGIGTKAFPKLAGATSKLATTAGQAGRLATEGAVAGAALEPENDQSRLEQAVTFAAFGGAVPVAVSGVKGVGGYVGQGFKALAKNIGGVADSTLQTVNRLGASRVFEPAKASADYISTNLVPRVRAKLNSAYQSFTPEVQSLLKDSYGAPEEAVNKIKKLGVDTVNQIRQKYNDSTDYFSTAIKDAIESKKATADKMYVDAVDSMKGDTIYLNSMMRTLKSKLMAAKFIDFQGNPTTTYKSGLDPQLDALATLYLQLKPQGATKGSIISKEQFSLYRDMLGRMLKERPSDRFVMQVRNGLYKDAERSGMAGLRAARNEERKAFSVINKYIAPDGNLRALGKEKSLDRLHSLSEDQRRQLKDLEKLTGVKFYDELDALVSARSLDKLSKVTDENIMSDLISAKDANRTNMIKDKYKKILGKGFQDEYDDLMAHFANADFNIISTTPGAGGGMFPSRAGFIRGATSGAIKKYLKDVRPVLGKLSSEIQSTGSKLKQAVIAEREKPINLKSFGVKGSPAVAGTSSILKDGINGDSFDFTMGNEVSGNKTKQYSGGKLISNYGIEKQVLDEYNADNKSNINLKDIDYDTARKVHTNYISKFKVPKLSGNSNLILDDTAYKWGRDYTTKAIQKIIGTKPDGIWGVKSQNRFREYQKINSDEDIAYELLRLNDKHILSQSKERIKKYGNGWNNRQKRLKQLIKRSEYGLRKEKR